MGHYTPATADVKNAGAHEKRLNHGRKLFKVGYWGRAREKK
jgi:hypothetical protein